VRRITGPRAVQADERRAQPERAALEEKIVLARLGLLIVLFVGVAFAPSNAAALIIDPPQTITHEVTVHVIHVRDDAGSNPAPLLGSALQQAAIEAFVDQIWAQVGIDIVFEASVSTWDDTFGLQGSASPRPMSDLSQMMIDASGDGVLSSDPNVLNMFFVDVVPGSSQNGDNTVNGLAFVGGDGSAMWVGPNLPGFGSGQEAVASVLSHEIGHNLGLGHIVEGFNLMQSSIQPDQGERFSAAQIATSLASSFSVALAVPEPSMMVLWAMSFAVLARARRRAA